MIYCETERLCEVLSAFESATGIRIAFFDTERRYSVSSGTPPPSFCNMVHSVCGEEACSASDGALIEKCKESCRPEMHRCHAGLVDVCAPVMKGELLLGYLIFGQVRLADCTSPSESVLSSVSDRDAVLAEYRAIPVVSEERLSATVKLACMLASYIIREDMILLENSEESKRLAEYVEQNLDRNLTVADVCRDLRLSKTALYRLFDKSLGCGVKQYLCVRRIERAQQLLSEGVLSVTEVASAVGIGNLHHFCRLFKKKTGVTPLEYKKQKRRYQNV